MTWCNDIWYDYDIITVRVRIPRRPAERGYGLLWFCCILCTRMFTWPNLTTTTNNLSDRTRRRRYDELVARSLRRTWVVRLGVEAHVTVVLAVHEPGAWRRVVVHHPPDAERVHVTEASGACVTRVVRLFFVVVPGQIVFETVPDERHAVVLRLFRQRSRCRPGRHVHHLAVRGPERVRLQRLFVQRLLFPSRGRRGRRDRSHGGRRRTPSVRSSRHIVAVSSVRSGRDRVDVHWPHGIVVADGRRCAGRLRPSELRCYWTRRRPGRGESQWWRLGVGRVHERWTTPRRFPGWCLGDRYNGRRPGDDCGRGRPVRWHRDGRTSYRWYVFGRRHGLTDGRLCADEQLLVLHYSVTCSTYYYY